MVPEDEKQTEQMAGAASLRPSREEVRKERLRETMREKVVQSLKDFWRPYHGSTAHREDADGNQMVEKKKSGGHMPLNAAVMAIMDPESEKELKLLSARDLLSRELYRLAVGTREEILMFAHIQDLFGRYGAGDSDYDDLREGAARDRELGSSAGEKPEVLKKKAPPAHFRRQPVMGKRKRAENARLPEEGPRCSVRRHLKALIVDAGIDRITERLIESGVGSRDFWADFGLPGIPSTRTITKDERYRRYYLLFLEECDRLRRENPGKTRVRTRAAQNVAKDENTTERTVWEAVGQCESGYVDLGDPEGD